MDKRFVAVVDLHFQKAAFVSQCDQFGTNMNLRYVSIQIRQLAAFLTRIPIGELAAHRVIIAVYLGAFCILAIFARVTHMVEVGEAEGGEANFKLMAVISGRTSSHDFHNQNL